MNNLELFYSTRVKFGMTVAIKNVISSLVTENKSLWIAFSDRIEIYDVKSGVFLKRYLIKDILSITFLILEKCVCVITKVGLTFITLEEIDTPLVMNFDEGIICAAWSPLQDTIAIIGTDYFIRTYNIDIENHFIECTGAVNFMTSCNDLFVNVGWGSSDTQFRGSAGRTETSEDDTACKITEVTEEAETEDRKEYHTKFPGDFLITWHVEGDLFAVGYSIDLQHHFKIFSNPCEQLHKGQYVDGLQKQLAWNPEGEQLIVGHAVTERESSIVFFEKNGLFKDKFKILNGMPVEKFGWSPCGQILAVFQVDEDNHTLNLNLWTESNHHWYLKQSLQFSNTRPLEHFYWSNNPPMKLNQINCLTRNDFIVYNFRHIVHRTARVEAGDQSCVAVIDGDLLKLTNFRQEIVAPPYTEVMFPFHCPVNFVAFGPCGQKLFVVLSDNTAIYISLNYNRSGILLPRQERRFNLSELFPKSYLPLSLHHFVWRCCHTVIWVVLNEDSNIQSNDLCGLDVTSEEFTPNYALLTPVSPTLNILLPEYGHGFVIQQEFNTVSHLLDAHENPFLMDRQSRRSELCFQMARIKLDQEAVEACTHIAGNKFSIFSLTGDENLYCDEFLVASSVSSFMLHCNYLLFTTKKGDLYVVRIRDDFTYADLKLDYCRKIAEGSCKIITSVLNSSELILQAPRGNLETVYCRLLGIDVVESLLQRNEWEKAYLFMRKTKLSLNLFIDLDYDRFFSNIDMVVDAIKSVDGIYALLMQLDEVNVFNTIYANSSPGKVIELPNKKEAVAKAMLKYFERHNCSHYIKPILTCCAITGNLKKALLYLRHLLSARNNASLRRRLKVSALQAFNHLTLMVPANILYTAALATYDLDLTLFIASNGNMDPLEYVPVLNELRKLDDLYKRFKVNDMLQNYEQAMYYLCSCLYKVSAEEIFEYIEKHNLFKLAMKCIQASPNKQFQIQMARLYAKHLSRWNNHEEAAYFYKLGMDFESAITQYILCCKWIQAYGVCQLLEYDQLQLKEFFLAVVQQLKKTQRYQDCAIVYEKHLKSYEIAVSYYLMAQNFSDAFRVAVQNNRQDLVDSDIKTALLSHARATDERIVKMLDDFKTHLLRLTVVRQMKMEQLQSYQDFSSTVRVRDVFSNEYDELYSEAGSSRSTSSRITSSSSRSTSRSTRSRRKEALKKINLKVGGEYEDIALINALHNIMKQTYDMRLVVRELCCDLMELDGIYGIALTMYRNFENLMKETRIRKFEIWPKHMDPLAVKSGDKSDEYKVLTENLHLLDLEFRHPPVETPCRWEIFSLQDLEDMRD